MGRCPTIPKLLCATWVSANVFSSAADVGGDGDGDGDGDFFVGPNSCAHQMCSRFLHTSDEEDIEHIMPAGDNPFANEPALNFGEHELK